MRLKDGRVWPVTEVCELLALEGAEPVAVYDADFYAGTPCLTRNRFGKGEAWYAAARLTQQGLDALYGDLAAQLQLERALPCKLPAGVVATERGGAAFVQNYSGKSQVLRLAGAYTDLLTGERVEGMTTLRENGVLVLKKEDA